MGKRSLFKNDCFGIKRKLFVWKSVRRLKRINHIQIKMLEKLLNMALDIGCPCNAEQAKTLQWVCGKYDALFEKINNEMNGVKGMIGES